jgi:hypothetical protein
MAPYTSNFLNCQDSVIDKLRLDPVLDRARAREWLNAILLDVSLQTGFFNGTVAGPPLSAGATSMALPAGIVGLQTVTSSYGGQAILMQPVGFDEILQRRTAQGTSAIGQPRFYSLQKDLIELWPTASGGELLLCYGTTLPNEMIADTDVSGLPDPFAINLLVMGAAIDAADFKSDVKLYFYYQQAYAAWMAKFETYLNRRITQSSRYIPIFGPDGRPFDASGWVPHDMSSDFFVTGAR